MDLQLLIRKMQITFKNATKKYAKVTTKNLESYAEFKLIMQPLILLKTGITDPSFDLLLEHGDPDFWLDELHHEVVTAKAAARSKQPLVNKKANLFADSLFKFDRDKTINGKHEKVIQDFYKVCRQDLREQLKHPTPNIYTLLYKHPDGEYKLHAPRYNYWAGVYQSRLEQQVGE